MESNSSRRTRRRERFNEESIKKEQERIEIEGEFLVDILEKVPFVDVEDINNLKNRGIMTLSGLITTKVDLDLEFKGKMLKALEILLPVFKAKAEAFVRTSTLGDKDSEAYKVCKAYSRLVKVLKGKEKEEQTSEQISQVAIAPTTTTTTEAQVEQIAEGEQIAGTADTVSTEEHEVDLLKESLTGEDIQLKSMASSASGIAASSGIHASTASAIPAAIPTPQPADEAIPAAERKKRRNKDKNRLRKPSVRREAKARKEEEQARIREEEEATEECVFPALRTLEETRTVDQLKDELNVSQSLKDKLVTRLRKRMSKLKSMEDELACERLAGLAKDAKLLELMKANDGLAKELSELQKSMEAKEDELACERQSGLAKDAKLLEFQAQLDVQLKAADCAQTLVSVRLDEICNQTEIISTGVGSLVQDARIGWKQVSEVLKGTKSYFECYNLFDGLKHPPGHPSG